MYSIWNRLVFRDFAKQRKANDFPLLCKTLHNMGKTYMSCAFGMEACKQYYTTRYVRLPDLLLDLEMARNEGTYRNCGFTAQEYLIKPIVFAFNQNK